MAATSTYSGRRNCSLKDPLARGKQRKLEILNRRIADLLLDPKNSRAHSVTQLKRIARSIERFGFVVPVLITASGELIAGHGRVIAAQRVGLKEVPAILIDHLSDEEIKAFRVADNRLAELATWDKKLLGEALKELSELNFDIELTGFDMGECDLLIEGLEISGEDKADPVDDLPADSGPAVTEQGDLWTCGDHRLLCGDAQKEESYDRLMGDERAVMVFTDPPYGVPINGHVSGKGRIRHREFVQGSSRSTEGQRIEFLSQALLPMTRGCTDGAIVTVAMDWAHAFELLTASRSVGVDLKAICVWEKTNGGMGSLYRSQHELFFVFKVGAAPHINNIQLGRFGRTRTNIWRYAGMSSFGGRKTEEGNLLELHPTVKPIALVQDAILDVSNRGSIVLDPFAGSGSTLIACERTGRRARLMELDPRYCDAIVRRWQAYTGERARHAVTGRFFAEAGRKVARRARHG